jgi:hypothetical protein
MIDKERLTELLKEKGFSPDDIEQMIDKKRAQLGSQVTEDGLYALIAAEQGIKIKSEEPTLTIDAIVEGLNDIHLLARVVRVFDEKEFTKEGNKRGKLKSYLLGDASGKTYLTLWDKEVELYKGKIHTGNVIRLLNCISVRGPSGPQLRLGYKGRIVVEDEADYPHLIYQPPEQLQRKALSDIAPGDRSIEVRATISNIYRLLTYDACPKCQKRVIRSKDTFFCENCKTQVTPAKNLVVEIGIDDGSAHSHAVFFGDSASELLQETADAVAREMQSFIDAGYTARNAGLEYVLERRPELLGRDVLLTGAVTENDFSGVVLNVNDVRPIDCEEETNRILETMEREFGD